MIIHLCFQHIIEMAAILGLVWSMSILGFLYSDVLCIPPFVQPVRSHIFQYTIKYISSMLFALFKIAFITENALSPSEEIFSKMMLLDTSFVSCDFRKDFAKCLLYQEINPSLSQVLFYALLALFLFNPTKTLRHEARFWTLRVLGRIFCAPFFYVGFADFWLADQLNSLHTVFLDFQYFVCFYIQNSSWTDVTG